MVYSGMACCVSWLIYGTMLNDPYIYVSTNEDVILMFLNDVIQLMLSSSSGCRIVPQLGEGVSMPFRSQSVL